MSEEVEVRARKFAWIRPKSEGSYFHPYSPDQSSDTQSHPTAKASGNAS